MEEKLRKARPERIRVALWDDDTGSTPLELPARRMWPIGVVFALVFAIFAAIAWTSVRRMQSHAVRDVFDLTFVLFEGFWVLGWSVGVFILGALTILFLFYRESARLQEGRLVLVPRLGPLKIIIHYDLALVRNLRFEPVSGGDTVRIRFDYGEGRGTLGDGMPRPDAERLIETIRSAADAIGPAPEPATAASARTATPTDRPESPAAPALPPPSLTSPSTLALIGANLLPLAGVLYLGWDVGQVMVLYWAESAVIGFYTALKMAVVGKLAAVFAVPFFVGHYGAFMAVHFLFIYYMFVRGLEGSDPDPGVREALLGVFVPVWPALVALLLSHGVSFIVNFLGRREHVGATVSGIMSAPYKRIVVMQVTVIFGGWIVMILKNPAPALALLVVLKIVADVAAHRNEHARPKQ